MSSESPSVGIVARVISEAELLGPLVPTYLHLVASALFPIFTGAHASISIPSSASPPRKKGRGPHQGGLSKEETEAATKIEGLTPKDAVLFPLLAGLTLSSLYFLIKWLEDPTTLNKVLGYYFLQAGFVFGTKFFKDVFTVIRSFCLPAQYAQDGVLWKVNGFKQQYVTVSVKSEGQHDCCHSPLPGQLRRLPVPKIANALLWRLRALLYARYPLNLHVHKIVTLKTAVGLLDALSITTSATIVAFFTFVSKPWYVSNLIGFAFCYGSLQYMTPTTFFTGSLLLIALFFYDIYFVFYTPMMVTVATKLDIPIKLLFPRPPSPTELEKGLPSLAMLGLGDIVIPGMVIALALRFDLYLHYLKKAKTIKAKTIKATYVPVTGGWGERFWVGRSVAGPDLQAKSYSKTYFNSGLAGFSLGLVATVLVMQVTHQAQPALLYLVPSVLIFLWGTAVLKGDLYQMWNYSEEEDDDKEKSQSQARKKTITKTYKVERAEAEVHQPGESSRQEESPESQPEGERDDTGGTETAATPEPNGDSHAPAGTSPEPGPNAEQLDQQEKPQDPKTKLKKAVEKDEETCRHLMRFSIDFSRPRRRRRRRKNSNHPIQAPRAEPPASPTG